MAIRRANAAHSALKNDAGEWRAMAAAAKDGHDVTVYVSRDKSGRTMREEAVLRKLSAQGRARPL